MRGCAARGVLLLYAPVLLACAAGVCCCYCCDYHAACYYYNYCDHHYYPPDHNQLSPSPPSPTRYMESCTKCPAGRYVNYTGSDEVEDCERCPAGRFSNEPGMGECRCISRWSCGGAEPFVATAGYRACNAAAENCDSGAFPVKLRKMAEWYVCNAGPNRDKVLEAHGTTMAQQRDGMCEEYVLRDNGATGAPWDHSYNTQELVTGEEVRGKDGRPANWF